MLRVVLVTKNRMQHQEPETAWPAVNAAAVQSGESISAIT